MTKIQNPKHYDLEERTLKFAKEVRNFVSRLKKTINNMEDGKQLIRASGSTGANYSVTLEDERMVLIKEATELRKIFGAILEKSK